MLVEDGPFGASLDYPNPPRTTNSETMTEDLFRAVRAR